MTDEVAGGGEAPLDYGAVAAEIAGDLGVIAEPKQDAGQAGTPPPSDAGTGDADPGGEAVGAASDGETGVGASDAATAPPSAGAAGEPPPDAWRKDAKALWDKLPPEAQKEIRKREGDFASGISQYRNMAEVGHQYVQLIEPIRGNLERAGIKPSELLPQLVGAWTVMANGAPEQKAEMFRHLARDAGLDLGALASGQQTQPSAERTHIEKLQQRIAQLESSVTSVTQGQQQVQLAEMEKQILAMRDDGKHPYFNDVIMDMKTMLESGYAQDLDDAYQRATWANPVTRAKEEARIAAEASRKATSAAGARAAKAAQAASVNVRANGVGTRAGGGFVGSIDDTLNRAFAEIQSRGA